MKLMGIVLFLAVGVAAAQQQQQAAPPVAAAPTPAAAIDPTQLAALVKQQFGDTFTVPAKFASPVTLVADFDGDGVPDIAIVANSKDPIPDSYAFKYEVSDPYHAYFGFGNARLMSSFNVDPEHTHSVLVIFGVGKEAWRAATPKAKYVMVNVPFDTVEVGRMLTNKKKPPIFIIKTIESQIMDSALWFDTKKRHWHWEPGDTLQ
jgi:hypothetical protein